MAMIDFAVECYTMSCVCYKRHGFCVGSATGQHRLLSAESRAREARTRDPTPDPTRETHTSTSTSIDSMLASRLAARGAMNMLRSAPPAPSAPPARHHRQHDSTARQLACERLFIDVGANAGDSLGKFYTEPSCYEHCNERRTYPNGVSCKPAAETCGLQNGQWLGECSTANETCFCHSQAKANKCGWEWPYWMPLAARRQYCAVAFEPNPSLVGPLQSRANDLVRAGAAPHIRVRGGIAWSTRDGVATFGIDNSTFGSSLVLDKKSMDKFGKVARGAPVGEHPIQVRTLDAVTYLRSLTAPRISVKLDVEGSEFELLRDLLASGALCERVENFWIECTCAYLPPPSAPLA